MLKLKNIKKSYTTGDFIQHALQDVSLEFRNNEFVSILGPSGSGKTTLLNIIGGLDRYDAGDLIINGKSTKKFKDNDWDAYRNHCIGFIFQSYNLISHISVLANVEMCMTLSGISASERKERALEALKKVGLEEHSHKKPNQLSGGQMQRVAIARALVNDPDIILADEPTGALDSKTSVQIMELIKEISKDKLVIMVTHNKELAEEYSTRIVELHDGQIESDSKPVKTKENQEDNFKITKTSMSFLTALKLSFQNIKTKKGRTFLTAFASSIGIIGIALILSLSNGFDVEIDKFQNTALSSLPIAITEEAMELDEDKLKELQNQMTSTDENTYTDKQFVYPLPDVTEEMLHTNNLSQSYVDYIENISPNYVSGITYFRATAVNALVKNGDEYKVFDTTSLNVTVVPKSLDENQLGVLESNYDLLKGKFATEKNELVLIVDSKNRVAPTVLDGLGLDSSKESFSFDEIIGKEIKVIMNDDFYKAIEDKTGEDFFTFNTDFKAMYESEDSVTVKIVGIIRGKEDKRIMTSGTGIAYTEKLVEHIVSKNKDSAIVKAQKEKDYNVLNRQQFETDSENGLTKETFLTALGADSVPMMIYIFPRDFDSKDKILSYLDAYNDKQDNQDDKVLYTDMAELISSLSGDIMDAITIVLVAFSGISLVVSSIMIGIITYISVLERTREIGVLRALGARKKDITRVFNAETFIIGLASGALGIFIAWLLIFPANMIIENLSGLPNVAKMNPLHALILIIVSLTLTLIGGFIPARIASKKDPVEALRTE